MAAQGMRQVIADTFFDFTAKREGFTPFMYCDTLNLVTTGVGNLIDRGARNGFDVSPNAMSPAMSLPWKHKGPGWNSGNPIAGAPLSQGEIAAAWTATKLRQQNDQAFIAAGGIKQGGFKYAGFTDATLDMQGLKDLFQRTLNSFDNTLQQRYPGSYQKAPADAQQAIMSMSWALGPAFNFPAFKLAFDAGDFAKAGELSFFKGGGGTLENRSGRNAENVIMFNNAAEVVRAGGDFDRLFFPGRVTPGGGVGPNPAGSGGGTGGTGGAVAKLPNTGIAGFGKTAAVMGGTAAVGAAGWGLFELGKKRKWW